MNEILAKKLVELVDDEAVLQKLKTSSMDDALKLLAEQGIETTAEEFMDTLKVLGQVEEGEIDILSLEAVAGGKSKYWSNVCATFRGMWQGFKEGMGWT